MYTVVWEFKIIWVVSEYKMFPLLIMLMLVILPDSVWFSIHEIYVILEEAEKYFKRKNVTQFFQANGDVF